GGALCRREDELERVLLPRRARGLVGDATPEIDDLLAAVVRAEGRADLVVVVEVVLEDVAKTFPTGRCPPLCLGHASPLQLVNRRPGGSASHRVSPDFRYAGKTPSWPSIVATSR